MAEKKDEPSLSEKLLFYCTAFFILLAIFSLFAFLFLVPFVIEPAFLTISMDFDLEPAFCETLDSVNTKGQTNCSSWTSCKEGCTKDVYECTQIRVKYRLQKTETESEGSERVERAIRADYPAQYEDEVPAGDVEEAEPEVDPEWYFKGARLFPNVKGCGYPPILNCSIWMAAHVKQGSNFSCYYSRIEPSLVITNLDMHQVFLNLVFAMAIPIPSFIVAVLYLAAAYIYIYSPRNAAAAAAAAALESTPLPILTPIPPPTSGALTPASEVFREDLASFGHQLKVAMADDLSRDSVFTDSAPLSTSSINGNVNRMMTTSIMTPPGPIAEV